ncbi:MULTISPECIES: sugar phosphate nucleotidyltransferase [unclassified Clostridium]|uniref:sugar phosphate nucleotidyltransferase n=1 Tax=unclassified Clostridium TaxID=2614128 RepID=UPI0025BD9C0F|nr:sugar phosphate nucleotidyltransferase [Clostridium sp.]MCI6693194.1 NTP transferase domain-containing protein [Clostridium sp.]
MRAILLAAGIGSRLRPLTLETPKPLIQVKGEPIIERQIKALNDVGITDILIVTGYLNKKFEYLKEKYGVKILNNDKYDKYNNIYTMYLVRDYLKNSYVIEGDIYINKNFLKNDIVNSSYFSARKYNYKNEWILRVNDNNKVVDIEVGSEDGEYIMCGVSYWNEKDAEFIANKIEVCIENDNFNDLFWDDMVKDNINSMNINIEKINSDDIYEIDSLSDLKALEERLSLK